MNYKDFIGQVQSRARLATPDEAVKATRATLETLAERLYGNEPEHIASQLPAEIGIFLRNKTDEKFSVNEFYDRITEKEKIDKPEAIFHSRVVIEVLKEAISPGEFKDLLAQLPEEYEPVFESGSSGHMKK